MSKYEWETELAGPFLGVLLAFLLFFFLGLIGMALRGPSEAWKKRVEACEANGGIWYDARDEEAICISRDALIGETK